MRDSKYIFAAIGVLVVILGAVGFALFYDGGEEVVVEETTPFADTGNVRDITINTEDTTPPPDYTADWSSTQVEGSPAKAPLMRLITKEPVIGAGSYLVQKAGTAPPEVHVRYILHENGYIEDTPLAIVTDPVTLSEKTIRRIGEAQWTPDAQTALLRYIDEENEEIFSFVGQFGGFSRNTQTNASGSAPTIMPTSFTGRPLPNNIHTAAFSPDGKSIFYLVSTNDGQTGFIESVTTGVRIEVWTTLFRDITVQWRAPNAIVLHMNATLMAPGAVWVLDPVSGSMYNALGNEYALTPLMSDNGAKILYSMQEEKGGVFSLRVYDVESKDVTYLPIPTLAEKCTWEQYTARYVYCAVPNNFQINNFLELWYRGAIVADDTIWRFDTTNGAAKRISEPGASIGIPYDIVDMHMSPTNEHLIFRTRNNDMLWALQIPTVAPADFE